MDKRKIRDSIKMFWAIIFFWLYIPHLIMVLISGNSRRDLIFSDITVLKKQININICDILALLWLLHNSSYYRSVFYHRIGAVKSAIVSLYRPGNPYFTI